MGKTALAMAHKHSSIRNLRAMREIIFMYL